MKIALLSIRPEWVEKILSGEKVIEVRKQPPRGCDRILIYSTIDPKYPELSGKIVAEFRATEPLLSDKFGSRPLSELTCLTQEQVDAYSGGKPVYGLHTKVCFRRYDKPYTLADFGLKRAPQNYLYIPEEVYTKVVQPHQNTELQITCAHCQTVIKPPFGWDFDEDERVPICPVCGEEILLPEGW